MLKLHFAPNSRAVRILWLLEELELPYELNKMAFHPKDLKSDEHRARHPLGRVPVLEDGDIQIWESGAISGPVRPSPGGAGCGSGLGSHARPPVSAAAATRASSHQCLDWAGRGGA